MVERPWVGLAIKSAMLPVGFKANNAGRGSRSRSRERGGTKEPGNTGTTANNEKTNVRSCNCRCEVGEQIHLVSEDDEAYKNVQFHPCNCTQCGPGVRGRRQCTIQVMEGYQVCQDCQVPGMCVVAAVRESLSVEAAALQSFCEK